jgi:hypothetical protein
MATQEQVPQGEQTNTGLRVSRRRAIQGAAWSVPVISVATAAPAFAGSGDPVWTVTRTAFSGMSGNYTYGFTVNVSSGTLNGLNVVWAANSGIGNTTTTATAFTGWVGTPGGTNTSGAQWTQWAFVSSTPSITSATGPVTYNGTMTAVAAGDVPITITFQASNSATTFQWTQNPVGTLTP